MSFWCTFGSAFFECYVRILQKWQNFFRKIVEKMCHNPAILFEIEKRGFIKEGFESRFGFG